MDEGQDDKKGKKKNKVTGGKSTNVNGNTGNAGAKDTKTTKNGNFEVPQTSSKQNRAQNNDEQKKKSKSETKNQNRKRNRPAVPTKSDMDGNHRCMGEFLRTNQI